MSDTVIRVENLSKKYVLSHQKETGAYRYKSLRDTLTNSTKGLFNRFGNSGKTLDSSREEFWALRDVSFEIKQGDRVGIIGRNGAGKSTLLKVLSRITEPSQGRISIKGRVASLLEVGTGFHPELTGRENIFLNGAILGMSKFEIQRKFDEIVAFAEVEKFLDTPVKRYSSGMYVRLAFAVAAHLEPEILVVDEVLAVGDSAFQQKCLGKMKDVGKEGRTIFFVSHNMAAILMLCDRAILLNQGSCIGDGDPSTMISQYLAMGKLHSGEVVSASKADSNQKLKISKVRLVDGFGKASSEFNLLDEVILEIYFDVLKAGTGYSLSATVHNLQYGCIFATSIIDPDPDLYLSRFYDTGTYCARVKLPTEILRGGEYWIKVASAIPNVEVLDIVSEELIFSLLDSSSPVAKTTEGREGCILPILEWQVI